MLRDLLLALKNAKTQRIMEIAYRNLEKVGVDRNTARMLVQELNEDDREEESNMDEQLLNNERLTQLVRELLTSIDDNCYEFSEKLNVIKGSGILADELKLLGFDYMNTWLEDAEDEDYWEEPDWEDDEYTPSAENGDYSPSNPWDAPGCSIDMFIRGVYD